MSRARFLADEVLSGTIVATVRGMAPEIELFTIVERKLASTSDQAVLEFAWQEMLLVVSHDKSTMIPAAKERIADGLALHGVFLAPQTKLTRAIAESLILICGASEFEEWRDQSCNCHSNSISASS